jgi:cytochrome c oxidase assembly protein subunit 11
VECFCFEEQKLLAGEEIDMPLLFFIDKDVLDDPACRGVDDIVLSYTFFRYNDFFQLLVAISLNDFNRARRNAAGQLEPDASDVAVQKSLGFGDYENAPKATASIVPTKSQDR